MATNHPDHGPDDSLIRNPEVSYERRDLNARSILVFLIFLGILGLGVYALIYGMYRGMEKYAEMQDPQLHPLTPKDNLKRPVIVPANVPVNLQKFPEPRLQFEEVNDMRTFLTQEERLLEAPPWKDESGKVHIPIDRAKELIAERGLPARNAQAPGEAYEGTGVANPSGQPPAYQTESGNMSWTDVNKSSNTAETSGETEGPSKREQSKPAPSEKQPR